MTHRSEPADPGPAQLLHVLPYGYTGPVGLGLGWLFKSIFWITFYMDILFVCDQTHIILRKRKPALKKICPQRRISFLQSPRAVLGSVQLRSSRAAARACPGVMGSSLLFGFL